MSAGELTRAEWRLLRDLRTPAGIQRFLDERLAYDLEPDGPRCRSVRVTLKAGRAHCMSGALVGAAALRALGHPPLLVDLEAVRDDDHVLAVYRVNGCWGAVAKSNYSGLRSREPVYRTLRELAISYFEHYYNPGREKTLRKYSRPVNLARFDARRWMTSEEDVWFVAEHLAGVPHIPLLDRARERRLAPMDARLFEAGRLGAAL
jgi:hypothetical protein